VRFGTRDGDKYAGDEPGPAADALPILDDAVASLL
jgi:hypothetical protein